MVDETVGTMEQKVPSCIPRTLFKLTKRICITFCNTLGYGERGT